MGVLGGAVGCCRGWHWEALEDHAEMLDGMALRWCRALYWDAEGDCTGML